MTDSILKYLKAIDSDCTADVNAAFEECKAVTGITPESAFLSDPPSSPIWLYRNTTIFEFRSFNGRGFKIYNITKRVSDLDVARETVGEGMMKVTAHINFAEPISITLKATGINIKYLNQLIYSLLIPNLM